MRSILFRKIELIHSRARAATVASGNIIPSGVCAAGCPVRNCCELFARKTHNSLKKREREREGGGGGERGELRVFSFGSRVARVRAFDKWSDSEFATWKSARGFISDARTSGKGI